MNTLENFANKLSKLIKTNKEMELPAFLGNLSGTVKADDANHVYVTLQPSGEVKTVYNGKVPNVPRLPVIIAYSKKSQQFEIVRARDVYVTPVYPDVAPHALLHTFPGVDTIPVRGEQFLPGLVTPAGGVTVKLYGFIYQLADGWHVVPTQTIDLSSHVPSTGALYVLLQVDDTGTVTVTDGTAVDTREELGLDDIPESDPDQFVVAAIKLYNSQTNLIFTTTDTDIVDLRWGRGGSGGGGTWGSITGTLADQTDLQTELDDKVSLSGSETIAGVKTFSDTPIIPDEMYDVTVWDGKLEPPTKNAVRDMFNGHTHAPLEIHNYSFIPANNADWDGGTDPGTAGDGIDQLAERVKDIEQTPATYNFYAHLLSQTIPAGATRYCAPFFINLLDTVERGLPILRAGKVKNFYVRILTTQNAGGSLVIHVRNITTGTDVITITVTSVDGSPVTKSQTSTESSFSAGDQIGFKFVNNYAGGVSAQIGFVAVELQNT